MIQSDKNDQPVLKEVFQNDFYIGAALNIEQITGKEPKAMGLVARHFNSITPENMPHNTRGFIK